MEQKNSWEISQLQKTDTKQEGQLTDHEKRIQSLERFKVGTVEKLITVFTMLEEIRESGKWIRRLVSSALITAIIGAIVSAVSWVIKGG